MAKWEPAIVHGNTGRGAIAFFDEDSKGDLVDIRFVCMACITEDEWPEDAKSWPGYDFSPDYNSCCSKCGYVIYKVEDDDDSPSFSLVDDGTLDTVIECDRCGEQFRYNQPEDVGDDDDAELGRDEWINDLIQELETEHECEEDDSD